MHAYSAGVARRLGTRPDSELLDLDTTMGAVSLRVADLDAMVEFYCGAARLTVQQHVKGPDGQARVVLGYQGVPVVLLDHAPQLRHAGPREAGLYHTAIVFERERDLALAVYSTATRYPDAFAGAADHGVSKAFYFNDPEGNGLELYWDRDRADWSWVGGFVDLKSDPLDVSRYVHHHLDEASVGGVTEIPATVGHVHLSVGDVELARDFYVVRLGFEVTAEVAGSALFVSAGGYHHHMAMNTWDSHNAGRRQLTLGLGVVRIRVTDADEVGQVADRLKHYGIDTQHHGDVLTFADPWNTAIEIAPIRA
jgi:catechol 2,3-dioxygenase